MNQFFCLMAVIGFFAVPASSSAPAQTAVAAKHQSPFACDMLALTPAERKRHFDELGPMLRGLRTGVHELSNGYEFQFPNDTKTYALLSEWVEQERRCCPFFDIDVHLDAEGGPLALRLTGRKGTKEFIAADFVKWMHP